MTHEDLLALQASTAYLVTHKASLGAYNADAQYLTDLGCAVMKVINHLEEQARPKPKPKKAKKHARNRKTKAKGK
jgi:hypothetical protein